MVSIKVVSEKAAADGCYPVHSGESIDAIVRRVWGRGAFFERSHDPNAPYDQVLRRIGRGQDYDVLATVLVTEGRSHHE